MRVVSILRLPRFRGVILCLAVLIAAWWGPAPCIAEPVGEGRIDSAGVIWRAPGPEYHTDILRRLFYGRRYGDLWTTPIRVEVLDLQNFAGGLEPLTRLEAGTGRGLLFRAADGSKYVFRGLGLDSTRPISRSATPDEFTRFLPVPVTSAHPAAPLISSALLKAAEVLHAHPGLVALPDDSILGTFRKEFGGRLGILEEIPGDGSERLGAEFPEATGIETTAGLLERMASDPAQRVDSRRYLAARLMDFLLGDFNWDPGQGRWARFENGGGSGWRPISPDMDHPFTRTGGILRAFNFASEIRLKAIQTGEDRQSDGPPVGARLESDDLDRNLLSDLDRAAWDSVTVALVARLSDAVIDSSVNTMPPEMRPRSAAGLSATLKRRRNHLTLFSRGYYRRLAQAVDIRTTDAPESVLIERLNARYVKVSLRGPGAGVPSGKRVYYDRTLDDRYTSELRVYLRGGHDRVVVRGPGRAGIALRIVSSGEGEDELVDSSSAGGVHFYDAAGRSQITALHGLHVDRKPYDPEPSTAALAHGARASNRDYGSSSTLSRWISAGRDNGFFIGAKFTHEKFGFRQPLHASLTMVRAAYSPDLKGYEIEASHEARRANSALYGTLLIRASTADVTHFFGFGNETPDTLSHARDPYRVKVAHYEMEPTLILQSSPRVAVTLGVPLRWTRSSDAASGEFIRVLHPYGSGSYARIGGRLGFLYGGTAPSFYGSRRPAGGLHLNVFGSYYPGTLGLVTGFGSVEGSSSLGLGSAAPSLPVLMLRLSGQKLWGTYPFSDAAFLGGRSSLLGLPAQRFAGDMSLLEENEANLRLARLTLLTPGYFGLLGMVAAGRVFVSGESSSKWHSAVGTGLWFSPVGWGTRLSLKYVRTEVRSGFYVRGALGF